MSELIAIVYPQEGTAAEVRGTLSRLQTERLIQLDDAVAVVKGHNGKVRIDQSIPTTAAGAAGGALWGTLIGMLFFAPLLGLAFGAIGGAISGKLTDIGIDDNLMKQLSTELQPGSSALFLLVRKATPDKVLEEIKPFGGTILRSSLTHDQEEVLQSALAGQSTDSSNA